jgi:hypothetical protein
MGPTLTHAYVESVHFPLKDSSGAPNGVGMIRDSKVSKDSLDVFRPVLKGNNLQPLLILTQKWLTSESRVEINWKNDTNSVQNVKLILSLNSIPDPKNTMHLGDSPEVTVQPGKVQKISISLEPRYSIHFPGLRPQSTFNIHLDKVNLSEPNESFLITYQNSLPLEPWNASPRILRPEDDRTLIPSGQYYQRLSDSKTVVDAIGKFTSHLWEKGINGKIVYERDSPSVYRFPQAEIDKPYYPHTIDVDSIFKTVLGSNIENSITADCNASAYSTALYGRMLGVDMKVLRIRGDYSGELFPDAENVVQVDSHGLETKSSWLIGKDSGTRVQFLAHQFAAYQATTTLQYSPTKSIGWRVFDACIGYKSDGSAPHVRYFENMPLNEYLEKGFIGGSQLRATFAPEIGLNWRPR